MVERQPSKLDVAGSNPVSRSTSLFSQALMTTSVSTDQSIVEGPPLDDVARRVLGTMRTPVEIVVVGGGHFGVLCPDTRDLDRSVEAQRELLARHLTWPEPRPSVEPDRVSATAPALSSET